MWEAVLNENKKMYFSSRLIIFRHFQLYKSQQISVHNVFLAILRPPVYIISVELLGKRHLFFMWMLKFFTRINFSTQSQNFSTHALFSILDTYSSPEAETWKKKCFYWCLFRKITFSPNECWNIFQKFNFRIGFPNFSVIET